MKAEIVTIGDELLIGQVLDTNAAWLAEQLDSGGFQVCRITSVSDKLNPIMQLLAETENRADLVLITGGLGPTKDDITKKALSQYFNMPLKSNPEVLENIRKVLKTKQVSMNGLNEQQALVPEGCRIFQNTIGTAPVMWFEHNSTVFVAMPGVPYEMKHLVSEQVLPAVQQHFHTPLIVHKTVLTTGIPEALLAEKLETWENALPENIKVAYLPSPGRNRLRLSGLGNNYTEIQTTLNKHIEELYTFIPEAIFGFDDDTLHQVIVELLSNNKLSLATAESCTGGNIARLITEVPGASNCFTGGIVAYSNQLKENKLGVPAESIAQHGAVSREVAAAMAAGACKSYNTDFAIAITGIAGPTGGTPQKPIGTTWIAVATPQNLITKHFRFGDNRNRNIRRTTKAALNLLRLQILQFLGLDHKYRFYQYTRQETKSNS